MIRHQAIEGLIISSGDAFNGAREAITRKPRHLQYKIEQFAVLERVHAVNSLHGKAAIIHLECKEMVFIMQNVFPRKAETRALYIIQLFA